MFTFFLVWMAITATLIGVSRRRSSKPQLLLPGQIDEEFRSAQARNDHAALIRYHRLALERALPPRDEQLVRINLAYSLTALGEYEQSLAELDRVVLKELAPEQVVLWLNNRSYTLMKLERFEEALEHLQDAQELLGGHQDNAPDRILAACINGTRGMVFYNMGDLDKAEKALQLALRLEAEGSTVGFDALQQEGDPSRTAERWYWLSEIARSRGQDAETIERLKRAARYPTTEYGFKAAKILRTTFGFSEEALRKMLQSASSPSLSSSRAS